MKPKFEKRHYVAIAELLHSERNGDCVGLVDSLARKFAAVFEADNPNFGRNRFLTAVNYKGRGF